MKEDKKEDKIRQDKIMRISKISIFISHILYTQGLAPKAKPPTARACFVSIRGLGAWDWEEPKRPGGSPVVTMG